ncbi:hypothetical protein R6Q57_004752 [Mikania cordata]
MANDGDATNTITSGLQTVPTQQSPQKSSMANDGDATEMLPISQLEEQSVENDQTQQNEETIPVLLRKRQSERIKMKWFGRFTNEESNPIILDNEEIDNEPTDFDKPIKYFLKPIKERKQKPKLKGKKIFMRCSPANLIIFLEKLNEDQKKAVKEMGFGEVLCLKLHTIPTAFGYWLLKNYNPETDVQNVGSSQFKITLDLIHLVFGIPNVVSEWRSQFGTDIPKKISMKDFAQHLTNRNDSGRMFKLNFRVMFFSIMGESMKSNIVNQRFLTSVTTKMDVKKLSWCDYVLTCLRKTRQTWNGGEYELFNGPLVLLANHVKNP